MLRGNYLFLSNPSNTGQREYIYLSILDIDSLSFFILFRFDRFRTLSFVAELNEDVYTKKKEGNTPH